MPAQLLTMITRSPEAYAGGWKLLAIIDRCFWFVVLLVSYRLFV
jgi:hypothetical protein